MNGRGRNGKHMSSIENVEIFEDTKRLCETNGRIKDTLARSVKNQKLIPEGMELPVVHKTRFADEAKIVVSTKRTFEAAAITTGNRTQAGGESYAVYVSLGRDGPADLPVIEVANGQGEQVKQLVSRKDWPDIFWMLSHTGKGQSRKDYADGGTGKASSFRVDHDNIQVKQKEQPNCADIDETERHAIFGGKITLMSGVAGQLFISAKAFAV